MKTHGVRGPFQFLLASGNLRRQQDLHFQIDQATAGSGTVSRKVKIKGTSGAETGLTVTCRH